MAIDAVIMKVEEVGGGDVLITLGPRTERDGSKSIPGQPALRIVRPTYRPMVGQQVWGGADTARTVANVPGSKVQEYRRGASGALIEV